MIKIKANITILSNASIMYKWKSNAIQMHEQYFIQERTITCNFIENIKQRSFVFSHSRRMLKLIVDINSGYKIACFCKRNKNVLWADSLV